MGKRKKMLGWGKGRKCYDREKNKDVRIGNRKKMLGLGKGRKCQDGEKEENVRMEEKEEEWKN